MEPNVLSENSPFVQDSIIPWRYKNEKTGRVFALLIFHITEKGMHDNELYK